jgi:DNA-binding response OmpR family regulator
MTPRHILIVDDEPRVAFILSKALERADHEYKVSIAHSGEEALEALNRSQVDLLITDLRLPGISGLELMRWVRASSPRTRAILITAYGNDEVEAEARRLEAYRYITKPFNVEHFTQAVQEALREAAASRPGLVVLSDEAFEAITRQLETLRSEIGARCIFLADMLGQRLVEVGITEGLDTATLLSLLAGGFAATSELARYFGSGKAANLNFHEGTRYEIYSATVSDDLFLALVYDRRVQASRIGLVWLYTRRAIENLLSAISAPAAASAQSLGAGFGASLMAELDTLFPGATPEKPSTPKPVGGRPVAPAAPVGTPAAVPPRPDEVQQPEGDAEQKLISLEEAISRGLVPPTWNSGEA